MLVSTGLVKCVLCLQRAADSREHLIPECVGGTLEARMLCAHCNSQFGASFVSQLKNDPSIRMAVHYLQDRIPELADKLQEGLNFVSEGTGGTKVTVSRKNGVWKTRGKQVFDNCLVNRLIRGAEIFEQYTGETWQSPN